MLDFDASKSVVSIGNGIFKLSYLPEETYDIFMLNSDSTRTKTINSVFVENNNLESIILE